MAKSNVSSSTIYDIKKQSRELYKFVVKGLSGSLIERIVMKKPKELDEFIYLSIWYSQLAITIYQPCQHIGTVHTLYILYMYVQSC